MVSAVFVLTLKMKEYLLNTSDTNKYSLLLNWKKSVVRSCYGTSGTCHGSRVGWAVLPSTVCRSCTCIILHTLLCQHLCLANILLLLP